MKTNKEQQQIIDEVYENYCKSFDAQSEIESHSFDTDPMTKIMFVEKIKNLDWFSKTWGLKIEERELSLEERIVIKNSKNIFISKGYIDDNGHLNDIGRLKLDKLIPTKLITLTYNNETIESYE